MCLVSCDAQLERFCQLGRQAKDSRGCRESVDVTLLSAVLVTQRITTWGTLPGALSLVRRVRPCSWRRDSMNKQDRAAHRFASRGSNNFSLQSSPCSPKTRTSHRAGGHKQAPARQAAHPSLPVEPLRFLTRIALHWICRQGSVLAVVPGILKPMLVIYNQTRP